MARCNYFPHFPTHTREGHRADLAIKYAGVFSCNKLCLAWIKHLFVISCKQTLGFMKLLVMLNFICKHVTAWQGLKNYCLSIEFVYLVRNCSWLPQSVTVSFKLEINSLFLNCLKIGGFSQELRQTKVHLHKGIMKYNKENLSKCSWTEHSWVTTHECSFTVFT